MRARTGPVRLRGVVGAASAALLVLAACACDGPDRAQRGGPSGAVDRGTVRIVVVTHAQPSDPFWSVVANGVRDAGREMGVRTEYQAPAGFDMVEMSQLIDAAVASRPAGLVVSLPDAGALGPSVRAAVDAGIPVITINSGAEASAGVGALAHVGQTEYEAGFGAGERMARESVRRAICINQEVGNVALDLRCEGFAAGLAAAGGTTRVLAVEVGDPEETRQRIAGALRADAAVDGVLALGPLGAEPALRALADAGRTDDVAFATFDLSPGVLDALESDRATFAIDQQQYLQGYLPVVLLTKHLETGTMAGGGEVIRTGPGFVTAETAATVRALTARGIR